MSQVERGERFRALHQRDTAFVIPNPWDIGSAKALAALGFEALATTSAGFANSIGQRDYRAGRDAVLAHTAALAAATSLPLSVDLENGFGQEPAAVAETIRLAAQAGAVGGSIEDTTGSPDAPLFACEAAADRIRAAVETARGLDVTFTLTARADGFLNGRPDLRDVIQRLQAFQEAGADVLYAPGLRRVEDVATLVREVDRPVNVLIGLFGVDVGTDALAAAGARRISTGSLLSAAAYGAFVRAARELREAGTVGFLRAAGPDSQIGPLLDPS